ncbi:MAG: hypothetical protein KAH95_17955 [Spirochaetales bacterium]|nr:hypothetical protein [Spirochaetales bacterium]
MQLLIIRGYDVYIGKVDNLVVTIIPIEIKAAGTIRRDFFKGLDYFGEYIKNPSEKS